VLFLVRLKTIGMRLWFTLLSCLTIAILGTMQVLAGIENIQDKFVFVENTGKTDAYVRTLIAYEAGTMDKAKWDDLVVTSANSFWKATELEEIVAINGNNYVVVEFLYDGNQYPEGGTVVEGANGKHADGIVHPGEYTYCNLSQIYLMPEATNEDMIALDGNGNEKFDILVLSQAIQAAGWADAKTALDTGFGEFNENNVKAWFGDVTPKYVSTAAELQNELDAAVDGTTIMLADDIEGDVTVTQTAGVKLTIDGGNHTFAGSIIVDGKSARYEGAGVTIKNINFKADSLSEDAYINLGNGATNTRYTNNVTVSNCTFDYNGESDKVAIKSYTGGDWNLKVDGCEVSAKMHSLLQVTNVEKGLTVNGCKVYSKNGINLNNTPSLEMSGCTFDTQGYCVRFGVSGSTLNGTFTIADSNLKSANDEGDAVIIFRGNAEGSTLTLTNTTLTGDPQITGKTIN